MADLGCFVEDEDMVPEPEPIQEKKDVGEKIVNEELYQAIKNKITYREIAHKEPHMVGAAFSNLDNNFHIDKNTRLEEGSIPSFAAVTGLVALGIYSKNFIGKIVEDIKSLNVSIGGKGREEKVKMVSGNKQMQQGIKSFAEGFKTHQSAEQQAGGTE